MKNTQRDYYELIRKAKEKAEKRIKLEESFNLYNSKDETEFKEKLKKNRTKLTEENENLYKILKTKSKEEKEKILSIKEEYHLYSKTLYESILKLDQENIEYELLEKTAETNEIMKERTYHKESFSEILRFYINFPQASIDEFIETTYKFRKKLNVVFLKEINDTLSEFKGYSLDDTLEIISGNYNNNQ